MNRTGLLVAVVVALAAAGCVGFLLGDNPARFEASTATIDNDTATSHGYELNRTEDWTFDRNVTVENRTRRVIVTSRAAKYGREIDFGALGSQRAAVVGVLSTPGVSVAGEVINPVRFRGNADLATRATSGYESLEITGNATDETTITTLGTNTTVSTLPGRATFDGVAVDVLVHVTKVPHGDDYLVAAAVHPERVEDRAAVLDMFRNIRHGGDGG